MPRASATAEPGRDAPDATRLDRVRVWDLPTRLFHWLLVTAFATQWLTQDDARLLDYHVFAGYTIAALLAFRLVWGFAGTRYARFASFAFGPRKGLQHLRATLAGRHERHLGHNPAGTWSIYGLLMLALVTVATGLLTLGGAKQLGPLRGVLGYARGDTLAIVHKYLAWSMLALVALHVVGVVLASRAERENLAASMWVGTKRATEAFDGVPAAAAVALLMLLVAGAGAWAYFRGYAAARPDQPYLPFTLPPLAQNEAWNKECAGCHLDYHPSILPARSWDTLLREQHAHFGEDLDLDEATVGVLHDFAAAQPAESHVTPLAWKIDSTTPVAVTPLRVTETGYWKRRHAHLSNAEWTGVKPCACDACHLDAAAGTFLPGAIHLGQPVATAGKAR
jgi:cytochrome b